MKNSESLFTEKENYRLAIINHEIPELYCPMKLPQLTSPFICFANLLFVYLAKFCLQNSYDLINRIKDINLPHNKKLIPFDEQNLFPSIPPKDTINLVRELIEKTI